VKVFSGGTRPGTWWQSACGQPSLGPPCAGPPSKLGCGFPRFRPFSVVLGRLFCRSCSRGRCVGCVFSLFSAFVVVVAWVPFFVCSVVVSRFRCSFVCRRFVVSLFLRCLVVPSIPPRICFSIHATFNSTWGRPPPALVSAHRGTRYHVRYRFCHMYYIRQRSLFVVKSSLYARRRPLEGTGGRKRHVPASRPMKHARKIWHVPASRPMKHARKITPAGKTGDGTNKYTTAWDTEHPLKSRQRYSRLKRN